MHRTVDEAISAAYAKRAPADSCRRRLHQLCVRSGYPHASLWDKFILYIIYAKSVDNSDIGTNRPYFPFAESGLAVVSLPDCF